MHARFQKISFIVPLLIFFACAFTLSQKLMANKADGVAKVIVMKGEIKAKDASGKVFNVQKGMWLKEGSVIQSGDKSFCRLLFVDKSTMNLGANSQMVIDQFPESDSGIITLMKGQVRSKVTKDYMNIKDKDKSKLFIKTKTAAMGVRGTDFQVNYNPRNTNTSLITFSGAVAMAQLNAGNGFQRMNRQRLESIVSSSQAVMVREGELSAVGKNTSRATTPTKMNPVQLERLKKQEGQLEDDSAQSTPEKPKNKFRNPIPPGVDSKKFANSSRVNTEQRAEISNRPAEGFIDPRTGEYTPPAGSVLDLETVNIVEPPKGSIYDPISGTYLVPPELGSVDPQTGKYTPPEGMILTDDGTLIKNPDLGRSPASETEQNDQEVSVNSLPSKEVESSADVDDTQRLPSQEEELDKLTRETLQENEQQIDDELEQTLNETNRARTSFEFTRED